MYSTKPAIVIGFHGCDKTVQKQLLETKLNIKKSEKLYNWLGSGMYFWEGNLSRAGEWAVKLKDAGRIKTPSVIGSVIDLGSCLDLVNTDSLLLLKSSYDMFVESHSRIPGNVLPENKKDKKGNYDLLLRYLDCAVIESLHQFYRDTNKKEFDSVRAVFWEGEELYPNAGFREKNHIQICIRNPNCIKGYFLPREKDSHWCNP